MTNNHFNTTPDISPQNAVKAAKHVTWVGFWVNALLAVLKILAGVFGKSSAMIADGVHSFSDFLTDIIVIVMVGISRKKANALYQYGHGKYETFATMIIAIALVGVGFGIGYDSVLKIIRAANGEEIGRPHMIALVMAFISILAKEALFHYTKIRGEKIGSAAVVANAWHHRSDALSSVATLIGISGAMFLGHKWQILDPIAALVVSIFIIGVGINLAIPAVKELLEVSLPRPTLDEMARIVRDTPGVIAFHHFRSRRNGYYVIVDFHIKVQPDITLVDGHTIASAVEDRLRRKFGESMLCNIHVEPYNGENISADGSCED